MRITKLANDLIIYTFSGEWDINIIALIHDRKALLIDTGYEEHAKEVKKALDNDGIKPAVIINSHFHRDHFYGNSVFTDCTIMGSEHYQENFNKLAKDHHAKPTVLLKDGDSFTFGNHSLRFLSTPGHSRDSLAIIINERFVQVADTLMFTNDGKHILPLLKSDGNIDEHIRSLERLQVLSAVTTMIPAHGKIIEGKESIEHAIYLRTYYLRKLKELGKDAQIKDCLLEAEEKYEKLRLHETNIQNMFGSENK